MPIDENTVYEISLSEIYDDEFFNCRGPIDSITVMNLAADIKTKGLLQPVLVQPISEVKDLNIPSDKKFRLVVGFRRFKAHQINKTQTIRCLIRHGLNETDARVLNLSENIQREDLNIKQEAHAIRFLKMANWSAKQIGDRIGKSAHWVQVRLWLLELPEEIQDEVVIGNVNQAQVRNLWSLGSYEEQIEYVKELKNAKLKKLVKAPSVEKVIKNKKQPRTPIEIFAIQDMVREIFGNCFGTRLLAWAAGEIDDYRVHEAIKMEADANHKYYEIPAGLKPKEE